MKRVSVLMSTRSALSISSLNCWPVDIVIQLIWRESFGGGGRHNGRACIYGTLYNERVVSHTLLLLLLLHVFLIFWLSHRGLCVVAGRMGGGETAKVTH